MHYKPTEDQGSQMACKTVIQDDDAVQLAKDWRENVHTSEMYSAYRTELIDMLNKFQSMCNGHLGLISIAKHRTKFLEEGTQLVRSAQYGDEPNSREFEKVEVKKMLSQSTIKSIHMK